MNGRPHDPVHYPVHYADIVPDVQCIDVTQHFSFLRGNAIKYLWRAGAKGNVLEDLEKARWYIDREIEFQRIEYGEKKLAKQAKKRAKATQVPR